MPRLQTNRAYKRGEAHRDARLFIIVAEGEREDRYFGWFDQKSRRIRVQIVLREGTASAPKHFLARLNAWLDGAESQPKIRDSVWFVLDVDQWSRASIDELDSVCRQTPDWHIAISNPGFEVWLNLHTGPLPDGLENCDALKTLLGGRVRGGFHPNTVCPMIEQAIQYARDADTHPDQDYPDGMQTKVYRLAEGMLAVLGKNWR